MNMNQEMLTVLQNSLAVLQQGFSDLPEYQKQLTSPDLQSVLNLTAQRLHDNFPFHHPLYMGQMLKPPHQIAQLAYMLAMNINPNNHALDGGRASSEMEKEAVASIANLFGWQEHLGHLCGGGTLANLEALWVARELNKKTGRTTVLASSQSHYTHSRLSAVLEQPYRAVDADSEGAMDVKALERHLERGDVGLVVATVGNTLSGSIDPLPKIIALQQRFGFRLHVDTAYGGYFSLVDNLDPMTRMAFDAITHADSIVIDPHKHGLQPYGCGCVLFKDPQVGRIYKHDSPYTYFSSDELHLGEISLECSRAGASAVALWATQKAFPMTRGGAFAVSLQKCRQAALQLYQWLHETEGFTPLFGPQLDIVCWASTAKTAGETSERSRRLFKFAAKKGLHLAIASIPKNMCVALQGITNWDEESVVCLRACVMKPEHLMEMDSITSLLEECLIQLDN